MSYPINYPTPQSCDVQIFYGSNLGDSTNAPIVSRSWARPKGASFVWFTLIGGGGGGGSSEGTNDYGGGGSGAVTNCLMPAFLVPNQLQILTSPSSTISIVYQGPTSPNGYVLLTAVGGGIGGSATGGTGGTASARTAFAAAGLYQSIAGQACVFGSNITASTTTFLSAGSSQDNTVQSNYGYPIATNPSTGGGFFQISPITVGRGGSLNAASNGLIGGIGCGGGGSNATGGLSGGRGGQSMAVIISW